MPCLQLLRCAAAPRPSIKLPHAPGSASIPSDCLPPNLNLLALLLLLLLLTLLLPQVAEIAKAASQAVATDRSVLRRLLQDCLPADLLARLDIEALIDAMIASTVVTVDVTDSGSGKTPPGKTPSGKTPPGKTPPGKTPPGKANEVSVQVTQTLPGVPASAVDEKALGDKMAEEMNKNLAKDGLTATVTATASDAPATGRRLQQSGGYGGGYGGGCILIYVIIIPIPAGSTPSAVTTIAKTTATNTATNPTVLMALLTVSHSLLAGLAAAAPVADCCNP